MQELAPTHFTVGASAAAAIGATNIPEANMVAAAMARTLPVRFFDICNLQFKKLSVVMIAERATDIDLDADASEILHRDRTR